VARIPPDVDLRKLRSDPKLLKNLQPPGLLEVIREVKVEIEKLQALLVRTVAELSEQRADSDVAMGEVAVELSLSADDARRSIVDAEALTSRLPKTLALMENGELDLERPRRCAARRRVFRTTMPGRWMRLWRNVCQAKTLPRFRRLRRI